MVDFITRCKVDEMPRDVMVDRGAFVLCCPKMLFRTSSRQLNLRRVTGGTIRHKDAKKNLLAKKRNKGRPPRDRQHIATSARETAMGRYVMCGQTCFKKRSGPDSVSSDARAHFLELGR